MCCFVMKMCCSGKTKEKKGSKTLSRYGILCGLGALLALGSAVLGPVWLVTDERLPSLPKNVVTLVNVRFKIGLFQVCSKVVKPANLSIHFANPPCVQVKYTDLKGVNSTALGYNGLEFTPLVTMKLKMMAPFQIVATSLYFIGTMAALIGHCCSDYQSLIACGLFLLGGLSHGGGLIFLASSLSEAFWDLPQYYIYSTLDKLGESELPVYHYGWCFQLSGLALILSEIAAVLMISGYMARFPTVEDMVCVMVPGAERKLREQRGPSSEYLIRANQKLPLGAASSGQSSKPLGLPLQGGEDASLLCKIAPDICTSNPQSISYVDKSQLSPTLPAYPDTALKIRFNITDKEEPGVVDSQLSGFVDKEGIVDMRMISEQSRQQGSIGFGPPIGNEVSVGDLPTDDQQPPPIAFADNINCGFPEPPSMLPPPGDVPGYSYDQRYANLAGQTIPINLKHHQRNTSISAIQTQYVYQNFGTLQHNSSGIVRGPEPGTSVNLNNFNQRSMTLQNPKKLNKPKSFAGPNNFGTLNAERRRKNFAASGAASLMENSSFNTGSPV